MTLKGKECRLLATSVTKSNEENDMGFWNKFTEFLGFEIVRTRDDKGRYIADDKSTPDVDESKKKVYKSRSKKTAYKPNTNGGGRKGKKKKSSYKPSTDNNG